MRKHSLWLLLVLLLTASLAVETTAATKARERNRTRKTTEAEAETEPDAGPDTGEEQEGTEDYADAEAFLDAVYGLWFDTPEVPEGAGGGKDERIVYAENCLEILAPYRDAVFEEAKLTEAAQLLFAGLSTTASADLFADDPALVEALIDAGTCANLAATSRLCADYGLKLEGAETFIDAYLGEVKALYTKNEGGNKTETDETKGGDGPKTDTAGDENGSDEFAEKTDRNGFNEETNTAMEMGGFLFSIPEYFEPAEDAGTGMIGLKAEEDAVMLAIVPYDMGTGEDPAMASLLASMGGSAIDMMAAMVVGEMTESYEDGEVLSEEAVTFGGIEGKMLTITGTDPELGKTDLDIVLLMKDTTFLMAVLQQNEDSAYEYTPDFVRILESMEAAE